jgi:hypothetical protein
VEAFVSSVANLLASVSTFPTYARRFLQTGMSYWATSVERVSPLFGLRCRKERKE